ncbi:DUF1592 domain-containing protein [Lacipirellula sp.]|uniref:DUF1592 domain-containing protein n=1 Tax=Lacipirellula sp. TaxID=2691419 RepID=UPI003D0C5823
MTRQPWQVVALCLAAFAGTRGERMVCAEETAPQAAPAEAVGGLAIQHVLETYCYDCHVGEGAEAGIDFTTLATPAGIVGEPTAWVKPLEALRSGLMPPPEAEQPTVEERKALIQTIERFLAKSAESNAGDPGPVVVRRLNNVEYANTVRAITGVASLDPVREFPPDGAAGEGFMNVGNALGMSPALASKYYDAAKGIANHAVFTPTGMRFSPGESSLDHTDEYIRKIREFYQRFADEDVNGVTFSPQAVHKTRAGILPLERYFAATLAERDALRSGTKTLEEVAAANQLNAKYLQALWTELNAPADEQNVILTDVRQHWNAAAVGDAQRVADRVRAWQRALWKFNPIGRIGQTNAPTMWQEPVTPILARHELRTPLGAEATAEDRKIYLAATSADGKPASVVWRRPRLVRAGRPEILLRDAWRMDELYRRERESIFSQTAACLEAVDELGGTEDAAAVAEVAGKHGISPVSLVAWRQFLGETPGSTPYLGEVIPTRIEMISTYGFVKGWVTPDGASVLANSSDETAHTPATYPPHSVVVHPAPTKRVLVVWRSPVDGEAKVSASVQDTHPGCGNGIDWTLELRRGKTKQILSSGISNGDQLADLSYLAGLQLRKGDAIVLAVGPRDGEFTCDSTEVHFTIESGGQRWNLTDEIQADVLKENPRADLYGNANVWQFAFESTADRSLSPIPADSALARWELSADAAERKQLAAELQQLLAASTPAAGDSPNERLRAVLNNEEESLLTGLLSQAAATPGGQDAAYDAALGVDVSLFGKTPEGGAIEQESLGGKTGQIIEIRLPKTVAAGSEFAVDAELAEASANSTVQFQATTTRPPETAAFPEIPFVTLPESQSRQELEAMCGEFRELFPVALCYLQVVPVDEVISMVLHYREDSPLVRLMLSDAEKEELNRLWEELAFVSHEPEETMIAFEQMLEYATQVEPERVKHIESMRGTLNQRIEDFHAQQRGGEPLQLDAIVDWASSAYRRPLNDAEIAQLRTLYADLRAEELAHDEALRLLIARVLISPNFLYRVEAAPAEGLSGTVSDAQLANRLSYFLWSGPPDAQLHEAARTNSLNQREQLLGQTKRMLADGRVRQLATEFGCQWLNIHGFDKLDEKNERLFPTFAEVREPMYEEAIQLFTDLFQNNRSIVELLDSDHTFLNAELAAHYGIPGVEGEAWRRVDGVRAHGRGGVLGLGAVLAKQSGASRTSPVLRGNWLTSVVLDEALPPPPKDVPPLDDEIPEGMTERQLTERHARDPACMNCHARIDPFGFALEQYDAIGRRRDADAAGHPIDAAATLPDGTPVNGADSLRAYLSTNRRDEFVRHFCRKLLGYALGREVQLSDDPLLTRMTEELRANDFKVGVAIELIVDSKQFREIRSGANVAEPTTF